MERSDYWSFFAKCWNKDNQGWWYNPFAANGGGFAEVLSVCYRGRLLTMETYLEVPTFLRQGRRLAL